MAQTSTIEWTDATWNPVTGCSKISPGCKNCYADRMAFRLQSMSQPRYVNGFKLTLQPDLIRQPLEWKKPKMIFVNSMSDLFHEDVPLKFIKIVFGVMSKAYWHKFQILTKRSERLLEICEQLTWPDNVWMGVSVENQDYVYRIKHLKSIPAAVRFLSIEPLIGPITRLPLGRIDWVIVGGESGPRARPMNPEWVRKIRDICLNKNVPFFFKQWGGGHKSHYGRNLDGRTWEEMPVARARDLTTHSTRPPDSIPLKMLPRATA
jgi:protein gp37